ncbi:MAG: hypothetical protein WCI12_02860 [Actinomycetes bacterium]
MVAARSERASRNRYEGDGQSEHNIGHSKFQLGPGFAERHQNSILLCLVLVGAIVRATGLTDGSLAPDDTWVALTNLYSFSNTTHMLVTTPGFTLFEHLWTGLEPNSAWFAQLPTLVASAGGIVGCFFLVRFYRYPAWVALIAATIFTISDESTTYATALKPYAFDALLTMVLLWLGERVRRGPNWTTFATLGLASVFCAFISFSSAVVVVGVYLVLVGTVVAHRANIRQFALATLPVALCIGLIYVGIIRSGVTTTLSAFWRNHYIDLSSPVALLDSSLHAAHGLVYLQLGFTPTAPDLQLLGVLYAGVLCGAIVIGATWSWRRNMMPLGILTTAVVLSMLHKIPLGSNRTDGYLIPTMLLLVAGGITSIAQFASRRRETVRRISVAALLVCAAVLLALRVASNPTYPGGNISPAIASVDQDLRNPDVVVLIEATARYPWAYYADRSATLILGPSFNTGFSVASSRRRIIIAPTSFAEAAENYAGVIPRLSRVTSVTSLAYDSQSPADHLRFQAAMSQACFTLRGETIKARYIVSRYKRTSPHCSR